MAAPLTEDEVALFKRDFDEFVTAARQSDIAHSRSLQDANQSGFIDKRELAGLLQKQLLQAPTPEQVSVCLRMFDRDGVTVHPSASVAVWPI